MTAIEDYNERGGWRRQSGIARAAVRGRAVLRKFFPGLLRSAPERRAVERPRVVLELCARGAVDVHHVPRLVVAERDPLAQGALHAGLVERVVGSRVGRLEGELAEGN